MQYIVHWKRLLLFTNGLCPRCKHLKPGHLEALFLLAALKLPVKNSKDCNGEVKLIKKWHLNSFNISVFHYTLLVSNKNIFTHVVTSVDISLQLCLHSSDPSLAILKRGGGINLIAYPGGREGLWKILKRRWRYGSGAGLLKGGGSWHFVYLIFSRFIILHVEITLHLKKNIFFCGLKLSKDKPENIS